MVITIILGLIFVIVNTIDVWLIKTYVQKFGEDKTMVLRGIGSVMLALFILVPMIKVTSIFGCLVLLIAGIYGVFCTHISLLGMSRCNIVISETFIKVSFVINVFIDILLGYLTYNVYVLIGSIILFISMIFMIDIKGQEINKKTLIYPFLGFILFGVQPYFVRYGYDKNLFNTEAYVLVYLIMLVVYFALRAGVKSIKYEKSDIESIAIQGIVFLAAITLQSFGNTVCIPSIFRAITVLALGLIYIIGLINKQEKYLLTKTTGIVLSIIGIAIISIR